jgi:EAL domain-containing protein (putative c-di-GMP-specific phosphodiesterase class I)
VLITLDGTRLRPQSITSPDHPVRRVLADFAQSLEPPTLATLPVETLTMRRIRVLAGKSEVPVAPELNELKQTLRRLPMELFVQPLVPILSSSSPPYYEVLLRFKSEAAPTEAPLALLKAASDHGLGSMLDRRVLVSLVGWWRNHGAAAIEDGTMFSVNLTATSLHDIEFIRFIEHLLTRSALPKRFLAVEIDAAQCLQYRGAVQSICTDLQRLECPVVLDDFEPRERGLDLLRLPGIRLLKLSPEFIESTRTDKAAQAMVSAVVQVSRVLGLQTVAKHASRSIDTEWLRDVGIDFLQSQSAAKPVPLQGLASGAAARRDRPRITVAD